MIDCQPHQGKVVYVKCNSFNMGINGEQICITSAIIIYFLDPAEIPITNID